MKGTEVHVTDVGRNTTIVGIPVPSHGYRECSKCHKKDHFAKVCKTKRVNCVDLGDIHLRHQDGASGRSSEMHAHEYAFRVGVNTVNTDDLLEVEMGGVKLHVLADSGAYSNLIDERTLEQLKAKHIKCTSNAVPQNKQIYAYASDKPLEIKGTFECEVRARKGREKAEFVVVRGRGVPLLGKQTATKLGMMKVGIYVGAVTSHAEKVRHEFPDVFTGLGKMKDTQITLHVDPSVTPVAQPLRGPRSRSHPVPASGTSRGKIETVGRIGYHRTSCRPAPWINPTVIAPNPRRHCRMARYYEFNIPIELDNPLYLLVTFKLRLHSRSIYWITISSLTIVYMTV